MGAAPIPWTAASEYAAAHGINDPDDLAEFWELLSALDVTFLEHVREKTKSQAKSNTAEKPNSRR